MLCSVNSSWISPLELEPHHRSSNNGECVDIQMLQNMFTWKLLRFRNITTTVTKMSVPIRQQVCRFGSKCTGMGLAVTCCCVSGCVSVSHHMCRIQHCDETKVKVAILMAQATARNCKGGSVTDWAENSRCISGRTVKQIRHRWYAQLDPRQPWTVHKKRGYNNSSKGFLLWK